MSVSATDQPEVKYAKKDFQSDQFVRWCPGCGDYAVLSSVQTCFSKLGIPKEKFVVVSGIGCSSRFPYYMNTYGFHGIHGRAPAIATGIKASNPELSVWVATGDGDALSIGGNHLLHALRRNIDIKILVFNNRIYGLTKGQCSPTSEYGKVTKSTPHGSPDYPVNPVSLALAAEATFVARTADVYLKHLQEIIERAANHRGSVFVEILQNCVIFNHGAWKNITDREVRDDKQVMMKHGEPLLFGKGLDKGLKLKGMDVEVVKVGKGGVPKEELLVHDEHCESQAHAYMLSRLDDPLPIGILRDIDRPTFEDRSYGQIEEAKSKPGAGDLERLLKGPETWTVE